MEGATHQRRAGLRRLQCVARILDVLEAEPVAQQHDHGIGGGRCLARLVVRDATGKALVASTTHIDALRYEQAQGAMKIAKFYEKKKQFDGALVYYNEVLLKDPNSWINWEL